MFTADHLHAGHDLPPSQQQPSVVQQTAVGKKKLIMASRVHRDIAQGSGAAHQAPDSKQDGVGRTTAHHASQHTAKAAQRHADVAVEPDVAAVVHAHKAVAGRQRKNTMGVAAPKQDGNDSNTQAKPAKIKKNKNKFKAAEEQLQTTNAPALSKDMKPLQESVQTECVQTEDASKSHNHKRIKHNANQALQPQPQRQEAAVLHVDAQKPSKPSSKQKSHKEHQQEQQPQLSKQKASKLNQQTAGIHAAEHALPMSAGNAGQSSKLLDKMRAKLQGGRFRCVSSGSHACTCLNS